MLFSLMVAIQPDSVFYAWTLAIQPVRLFRQAYRRFVAILS